MKITLKRSADGRDWRGSGARSNVFICGTGLNRHIHVPKKAKALHIELSSDRPKSEINTLNVSRCYSGVYVGGQFETIDSAALSILNNLAGVHYFGHPFYATFEWS